MTSRDLLDEAFAATANVRSCHFTRLAELGVDLSALARLSAQMPIPGAGHIRRLSGAIYEPDPEGEAALIIPVMTPQSIDLSGYFMDTLEIVDLVAMSTAEPATWTWRVGTAWALNEEALSAATGDPVELVATPLDWLRSGGTATCILDWSPTSPAWGHLRAGPDLIVRNSLFRARIERAIRSTIRVPTMRRAPDAA